MPSSYTIEWLGSSSPWRVIDASRFIDGTLKLTINPIGRILHSREKIAIFYLKCFRKWLKDQESYALDFLALIGEAFVAGNGDEESFISSM
jgi:hypothetical protein